MKKKILIFLSALTLILTLSSCNRINLHTPTGDISDRIFASSGDVSITELELYDRLRSQHGLDYVNEHIRRFILAEQIEQIEGILGSTSPLEGDDLEIYQDIVEASLRSVFNTDDLEIISRMSENERRQAYARFSDNLFLQTGIRINPNQVVIDYKMEANDFTIESVEFNHIVLEQNILDVAAILFTRAEAERPGHQATVNDEDNPFYISREDKENQFERMLDFSTRTAIIISFPSAASRDALITQARTIVRNHPNIASDWDLPLADRDGFPIADGAQEEFEITYFFFTLYRLRHDMRITEPDLDGATAASNLETLLNHMTYYYYDNFVFEHDQDGNELANRNFEINDAFSDFENFQHQARRVGNDFDTATGVWGSEEFVTFIRINEDRLIDEDIETLEDFEYEGSEAEIKDMINRIIEIIRDNMITSSFANAHINRIIDSEEFEITIYDPIIEFLFARNRENFTFNRTRQNNLVLIIRHYSLDSDGNRLPNPRTNDDGLRVNDFFESLIKRHATENVAEMLINRWLVDQFGEHEQLPESASSDFAASFNQIARNFRNSEFRALGLNNYLLIQYGLGSREAVINYEFKASALWNIVMNDFEAFGQDFIAPDLDSQGRSRFYREGNTVFHFFENIIEQRFNQQFNLGIQHILITIDPNNDGSPADPETFFHSLDPDQQAEFTRTIQDLTFRIILETEYLIDTFDYNTMEALQIIRDNFNGDNPRNPSGRMYHTDLTWSGEFSRWYNISLTVEDLGNVTQANVTNFVTPFAERVRQLNETVNAYIAYHEYLDEDFEFEGYLERFGVTATGETTATDINIGLPRNVNSEGVSAFENGNGDEGNGNGLEYVTGTTLTPTIFGFHILNVTQTTEASTATFTPGNDWTVGGELRLRNVGVVLNPTAATDDQRIVYADVYSNYEIGPSNTFIALGDNPSASQLFTWFFESQRSGGATSGNTSVRNTISALFNPVITQFNDTNFQTWRFIQYMDDIVINSASDFANETLAANMNHYVNVIIENLFHNYDNVTNLENYQFYGWFNEYISMFTSTYRTFTNNNIRFGTIA